MVPAECKRLRLLCAAKSIKRQTLIKVLRRRALLCRRFSFGGAGLDVTAVGLQPLAAQSAIRSHRALATRRRRLHLAFNLLSADRMQAHRRSARSCPGA